MSGSLGVVVRNGHIDSGKVGMQETGETDRPSTADELNQYAAAM